MRSKYIYKIGLLLVFLLPFISFSQKTKINGRIIDAETKDPLAFVNIAFQNSKIGTTSDINGYYSIETYYATDSLVASFVGYMRLAKKVNIDKSQVIYFELQKSSVELKIIEVIGSKKDENPAHAIIRNVWRHKKANNREKLDAYNYEVYNKIEFDLNNLSEEFTNRKVYRPFKFVFQYIDSSEKKPFLPMFITETLSDFYYNKNPKSRKEVIKASKVSGMKNESISQFMGDMYQNVNIYDNYITMFNRSFMSPISNLGFFSYRYYLLDSVFVDNDWCYKIHFQPKRKSELTFVGDIWINDTTYAVKMIDAKMSGDANINFIYEFSVKQKYDQVEKEVWMLTKDELLVDFNIAKKTLGLYGRKTSTYRDFMINEPKENDFFSVAENVVFEENASNKTDEYWDKSRHEVLTDKEKAIYHMVDTIKEIPAFRTYLDIIQLVITGYHVKGLFEYGPYFTTFSFNPVEGARFRIGGRTSNKFSTRLMLETYLAYGTLDKRFKYGGGFMYFLSKKPRQFIGASYKNDVEQLGQGPNAWRQDNIIASVFRRNPASKLNGYEEFNAYFEREWFQGFSNRVDYTQRKIWPLGELVFEQTLNDGIVKDVQSFTTSEVSLLTRFAFKEKYVSGEFERVSLGTKWPVLALKYTTGLKGVLNSDYQYHKLQLVVSDKVLINPIGYSDFILETGKIFGRLPYPLLELHNGNETYSYDVTAFNLMNFYEFVSDQYISSTIVHHFNGLFLNKIPLMRKLKWREVGTIKGVLGSLEKENRTLLTMPPTISSLESKPYYEMGVGLENIFQFLRVDLLWRMSYINKDYVTTYNAARNEGAKIARWGIRGTIQVTF